MKKQTNYIYGRHAVSLALKYRPEVVQQLHVEKGETLTSDLQAICKKHKIRPQVLNKGMFPKDIMDESVHQGIIAAIEPDQLVISWEDFISEYEPSIDDCLVLLANIEDPHNVGAVIRSAGAFGVRGVLIPEHHQSPVNGTVVKVSVGMAFVTPLIQIGNINNALRQLQEKGCWVYGLDGESKQSLDKETFDAPTVFVMGNEGKGIKEKTQELCDVMLRIPMHSQCESLNVAASTAVALHTWSQQHPKALS